MDCSKCNWSNPETCRACHAGDIGWHFKSAEKKEIQQIQRVVDALVKTRQVELDPIETDPSWWELHLSFRKN